MNSTFIVALGTLCAWLGLGATQAHAQSSVTLYGRAVAGVDYQTNIADPAGSGTSSSLWRHAGNQWGTSMFGFKGSEDLGGGLTSLFLLESGFDLGNGKTNGSALFNRRSYVGLQDSWGKLVVGKNLSISNDVWYLDPTGQQFIGTATLVRGRSWQGNDNVIEYTTPSLGGLSATLQTGLGERTDGFARSRKDGVSVAYVAPTFELRAIYDVARDSNGKYSELFSNSKELTLGGTATVLDKLKLFGGYQRLSAPDAALAAPSKADHYWLGANYLVTPSLTLIGSIFRINQNKNAGSANLFMMGANYSLSKRTLLYASLGKVQNSRNTNFSVEATNNNPPAGEGQMGTYVGISHSF